MTDEEENAGSSESEDDDDNNNEDAAGRRTRLAERYLENTRAQILAEGFDAKDVDAELLAERTGERLKQDTAEGKGKLYKWIAGELDFAGAARAQFRADTDVVTGVAACPPYVYTVSKDMTLIKWETRARRDDSEAAGRADGTGKEKGTGQPNAAKPKKLVYTRGNGKRSRDVNFKHHTGAILCVAASADGKFVATGGQDKKLIVWEAETLTPLKIFTQHRDAVTSLCFRRNTNQLFSASKDRTVKTWSLDELAYVETLFGHQDEVVDVGALNQELCVTVGARDRTARYWRVVEESQLVFRGGKEAGKRRKGDDGREDVQQTYSEGSVDRIAMVDDETFITGSDNGSLSLWNIQRKKAVFTLPLAHGLDPPLKPEEASAELHPDPDVVGEPQPRWITALACVPFSNLILSGSWDGQVRAWRITDDKRRIEPLGPVACNEQALRKFPSPESSASSRTLDGGPDVPDYTQHEVPEDRKTVRGVINDIAVFERGDRGKDGVGIVVAAGKHHRLGRWLKGTGKNYAMLFEVSKTVPKKDGDDAEAEDGAASEDVALNA